MTHVTLSTEIGNIEIDLFTDSAQPWDLMHTGTEKRPRGFAS